MFYAFVYWQRGNVLKQMFHNHPTKHFLLLSPLQSDYSIYCSLSWFSTSGSAFPFTCGAVWLAVFGNEMNEYIGTLWSMHKELILSMNDHHFLRHTCHCFPWPDHSTRSQQQKVWCCDPQPFHFKDLSFKKPDLSFLLSKRTSLMLQSPNFSFQRYLFLF